MSLVKLGQIGEDIAKKLLIKNGYRIITQNFRCKLGEIDIIALHRDVLVFIEVKTRWSKKFGLPQEAVTGKKLERIKRTGEYFCLLSPNLPKKLRIDVVKIEIDGGSIKTAEIIKVD